MVYKLGNNYHIDELELRSVRPGEGKEGAGNKEIELVRFKMQKSRLEDLDSTILVGY